MIRTRIVTRKGLAIRVNYRVRREEAGRWRIYDLDVEGISLVRNYRSQFDSIIRRTSFEQLLARMKAVEDERTVHVKLSRARLERAQEGDAERCSRHRLTLSGAGPYYPAIDS